METMVGKYDPWSVFKIPVFRRIKALLFTPKKVQVPLGMGRRDGAPEQVFNSLKVDEQYKVDTLSEVKALRHLAYKFHGKKSCRYVTLKEGYLFWRLK